MTTDDLVTVMVVDDHAVVRTGLEMVLEGAADMLLVRTAANGAEALEAAAEAQPAVVLMDLAMPVMDGVEATRRLKEAHPEIKVLILTSLGERETILRALDAGGDGYLFKHAQPAEILEAIRSILDGGAPLDPKAARALLETSRGRTAGSKLSERETEVLRGLMDGLANKQIARRLGISEQTVKSHLTRVYQALGVADRTQAALWGRDHLS